LAAPEAYGQHDELSAVRTLGALSEAEGRRALLSALQTDDVLDKIVDIVWPALAELARPEQAATAAELHDKFSSKGYTMEFGKLKDFQGGLEAIIGPANPQVAKAMAREHTGMGDSQAPFTMPNRKAESTSTIEFHFVNNPKVRAFAHVPIERRLPLTSAACHCGSEVPTARARLSSPIPTRRVAASCCPSSISSR
jgi:hypothetical protein